MYVYNIPIEGASNRLAHACLSEWIMIPPLLYHLLPYSTTFIIPPYSWGILIEASQVVSLFSYRKAGGIFKGVPVASVMDSEHSSGQNRGSIVIRV